MIFFAVIAFLSPTAYAQHETRVLKRVRCVIDVYGFGPVVFDNISGPCDLIYGDPYPDYDGHIMIDTEILSMELMDGNISVRRNPFLVSAGIVRGISPGIDFPAESFFDVFVEIELPEHLPGNLYTNIEPMHIQGIIDQYPPYFASYINAGGPILLFDDGGTEVAVILEWEEYILPYYPPEAHITCPMSYKSEVAMLNEDGLIEFPASLNGIDDEDIEYAEFGYRPLGSLDPFTVFYMDYSGSGTDASTINPVGEGDGWCGYFEPGSEPFEGHVAECRVEFHAPEYGGFFRDTILVWIDPTPPIPEFSIWRDSIIVYDIDSFFDITFKLDDELPAPGPAELQVFTISVSFERTLTVVDQLGLGTDKDSSSCGPASAASCLKYFADNGYPGVDNPGGDESKPDQSGEDIAKELQGAMGTDKDAGTSNDGMVSGIKKFLEGHGQTGWEVSSHPVENDTDLGEMFREFEADSEDVLVLLQDTTTTGPGAGDTIGHCVTLGSREQTTYGVGDSTKQFIDFMDPWGGGSTADNKYEIGEDANGNPTTEGYDLDGAGGDAVIAGYIKVSPPEGGSGSSISRAPGSPSFDPYWIPVAAGTVRGNGEIDTLRWDTHGFMPGLYLMEVITTNHQGITCRDLRMVLLTDPTTDSDPGTPGIKTGLKGTYPNPFNPTTSIVYSIEKDGPVTLTVYDVSGRRVRTLLNAKMTGAGTHSVTWDGLDDNGRNVSSGVYFCRFSAENTESSTKMILLR
jgi:hypothetical protein